MESNEILDLNVAISELPRQRDQALNDSVTRAVQLGSVSRQLEQIKEVLGGVESERHELTVQVEDLTKQLKTKRARKVK